MRIVKQKVEHLASTANAMQLIEIAGRTCYKSEKKITNRSAEEFVRMIVKRGHDSVLEHASVTFRITTDRGISHEIVRHRVGMSYSQESTRYVNYGGDDMLFICPDELGKKQSNIKEFFDWKEICEASEITYKSMVENGISPQWARAVLPNCLKTEIVVTGNFRAWRHFLKLRMATGAHPQVQEIASMICEWFQTFYPVIVEDLVRK